MLHWLLRELERKKKITAGCTLAIIVACCPLECLLRGFLENRVNHLFGWHHAHYKPGEIPWAPFMTAIVLLVGILALTIHMIACVVFPGRKVHARIIDKLIEHVKLEGADHPIPMRYILADTGGCRLKLWADEWDYNRISVGEEGVIEYKKNELRGFSREPKEKQPAAIND